jgi:pentose-5-phosphate-3-epimerase
LESRGGQILVSAEANEHTAQCLNYLRASGRSVCLLVNFQRPKVEWKRIVHEFQIPDPPAAG